MHRVNKWMVNNVNGEMLEIRCVLKVRLDDTSSLKHEITKKWARVGGMNI